MFSENKMKFASIDNGPVLILVLIFIAVILVTICALGAMLLNQQKEPRPAPQQDIPVVIPVVSLPKASLPIAMPANHYWISLPIILKGPVSESGQIWKVTKIKNLGYKMGGQRYDLATFTRIDGQDTAQGYCINRGWDVPKIGTEYLLTPGGTFIPLEEPEADPFQRFLIIQ